MKVLESQLKDHVKRTCTLTTGTLHLFNAIAIIEFNQGANLTLENTADIFKTVIDHFGTSPFGLISNRVHSYSLDPLDSNEVKAHLSHLAAYGVVAIDSAGRMGGEIENNFCKTHNILFKSLYEAVDIISQRVKDVQNIEA